MKTKINIILLIQIISIFIIVSSCEKDESVKDILTSKTWTFDKLEADTSGLLVESIISYANNYYNGASGKFDKDGIYTLKISSGQAFLSNWELSLDDKQLFFLYLDETEVWDIMSITKSELVYSSMTVHLK